MNECDIVWCHEEQDEGEIYCYQHMLNWEQFKKYIMAGAQPNIDTPTMFNLYVAMIDRTKDI